MDSKEYNKIENFFPFLPQGVERGRVAALYLFFYFIIYISLVLSILLGNTL